ncbi:MAG: hypothetical protein ACOY93_05160 [Bacillota bacterium]
MRPSRLLVLLLAGALLLQACTKPPVQTAPAPVEPPPAREPQPEPSPVTWKISHTPSGLQAQGGPFHLAPPYSFAIDFSAPVDRASVEEALRRNLGSGRLQIARWPSDQRVLLTVEDLPTDPQLQAAIDPTGGQDQQGRRLQFPPQRFNLAAFIFWPAAPTAVLKLDPLTGETSTLARFPQPFQTVSLSPDGRRALLRRHILTPGQSVGTTGTAHLFDLETGYLEELEVGGLFEHQWSREGGLLIHGSCPQGPACVVWVAPGDPPSSARASLRRLLFLARDQHLAGARLSPDGRYAAVFAGTYEAKRDLHLFDLRPESAGRKIRTLPAAAGITQGPGGLIWVEAAWAPDGSALAFGDQGIRREERQPMQVWLVETEAGEPRLLAEGAGGIGPWSPRADRLFLPGLGLADRQGQLLLPSAEPNAAWSPDGSLLYVSGTLYEAASLEPRWSVKATGPGHWSPDGRWIAIAGSVRAELPGHPDGGLFRASDGAPLARGYLGGRPLFSPDSRWALLPGPDRLVDLTTGAVTPVRFDLPAVPNLGGYLPAGLTNEGTVLLALGHEWELR